MLRQYAGNTAASGVAGLPTPATLTRRGAVTPMLDPEAIPAPAMVVVAVAAAAAATSAVTSAGIAVMMTG